MPRRMSLRAPPAGFRGDEPAYLICPSQASSWEAETRTPVWLPMKAGMARVTQRNASLLPTRGLVTVTGAMKSQGCLCEALASMPA